MVSEAQRAEIARVPQGVLATILRLPHPSLAAVDAQLPEEHRHLAEAILALLVRPAPPASSIPSAPAAPEFPAAAPAGSPAEPAAPVQPTQPADVAQPAADPSPTAAFFGTDDFSSLMRRVDPNDLFDVPPEAFAPFEYHVDEANAPGVTIRRLENGSGPPRIALSWEPVRTTGASFYRIVVTDHIDRTPSPEDNRQLVITRDVYYEDPVPAGEVYREYQVWAYAAGTPLQALQTQPVLVGRELVIFPMTGVVINVADGTLSGTWNWFPGHHAVRVFVSPEGEGGRPDDPRYRLHTGVDERSFRYHSPRRGVRLRVAVVPEILRPDGTTMAGPRHVEYVQVEGKLEKTNLEYAFKEESPEGTVIRFGVMGPPAGTFRTYLTRTMPNADLSWEEVPEEALAQEGLEGPYSQRHDHGELGHGTQYETDHVWPEGWDEVYITPVTALGGRVRVGDSVVLQRVQAITEADLREYVGYQLVTFAWPRGASVVRIERNPLGGDDRIPVADVTEQKYRQHGGVKMDLDPGGEEVILTPQSLYRGEATSAAATVLSYPGLWCYYYTFGWFYPEGGSPGGLGVRIWRDGREDINPPRFMVLFHPERLPLFTRDLQGGGRTLPAAPGGPATRDLAGTVLMPRRLGPNMDDTEDWFISAEELNQPGYIRVLMIPPQTGDAGGPVKILSDEANQFHYLPANLVSPSRPRSTEPPPPPEQPARPPTAPRQQRPQRTQRRSFFGFGG